jgi:hypothetical protein
VPRVMPQAVPEEPREQSSRRSLTELLRKDAAWTDRLLRGAAFLAAKLPVD